MFDERDYRAQGQTILCSLGSLAPAPREHWLELAHRVEASLEGQLLWRRWKTEPFSPVWVGASEPPQNSPEGAPVGGDAERSSNVSVVSRRPRRDLNPCYRRESNEVV